MTANDVIQNLTIEDTKVILPYVQLERKEYLEVKKKLEGIGGKWKGGKINAFVFDQDPSGLIQEIQSGKKINLKKDFQFFETPPELAEKLVSLANLQDFESVLEPSAGRGAILKAISMFEDLNELILTIDYCELMPENRKVIDYYADQWGLGTFLGDDFLKADILPNSYYKVIANPPFTKDQDIKHLKRMYEVCKPGGIVVSIMSVGWLYNSTKAHKEFRKWIGIQPLYSDTDCRVFANQQSASMGSDTFARINDQRADEQVYIEMIDRGAFKSSGTNVPTCIVVINKR